MNKGNDAGFPEYMDNTNTIGTPFTHRDGEDICKAAGRQIVLHERPDHEEISRSGFSAVDMHFHTNHSDSPTRVRDALKLAEKKGIGLSITDHNEIGGVLEAEKRNTGVLVIPGMEISAWDGPHILVYFYDTSEMQEFFLKHVVPNRSDSPYLATRLTTQDIVELTGGYNCVTVAAHPYGYLLFNKGLQKCVDHEYLEQDIIRHFDGIEVISGGMGRKLNLKAEILARTFGIGMTGGTDGHLLNDLGNVVTCSHAGDIDGFLDSVGKMETHVIGLEKNILEKGVMATAVMTKYVRYTAPSLRIHYEQNLPRLMRTGERAVKKLKRAL